MLGGLPSTNNVEDWIQIPNVTEPQLATGDVHRMCIPDPLHVQVHANMICVHMHARREAKARDQGGNLLPPWSHTFATTIVKLVLITPNIFNSPSRRYQFLCFAHWFLLTIRELIIKLKAERIYITKQSRFNFFT